MTFRFAPAYQKKGQAFVVRTGPYKIGEYDVPVLWESSEVMRHGRVNRLLVEYPDGQREVVDLGEGAPVDGRTAFNLKVIGPLS